jgi:transposase
MDLSRTLSDEIYFISIATSISFFRVCHSSCLVSGGHVNLAITESYVVILILSYEEVRKIYDQNFRAKDTQFYPDWTIILELVKKLGRTAPQLYKWRKEFDEFRKRKFPCERKIKTYSRARKNPCTEKKD